MVTPFVFEDEVRRIARARWPQAALSGAVILEGRERDGKFETDECVHFLEATTRRDAEKAREDTKKLFKAIVAQHKATPHKAARGWLVTQHEPTAEQRAQVSEHGKSQVSICSFSQFQQALVDAPAYLSARSDHFFGSVLDPRTGSPTPDVAYVPLDIFESTNGELLTIEHLAGQVSDGKHFVLLGDYGAGKSMTLRQIFFQLRDSYLANRTQRFPIYLNLREHSGQYDPAEVLERHARLIGFHNPPSLVRAWKAGYAIPLLDGFDELTTLGAAGFGLRLKEVRRSSLSAVRKLIEQCPRDSGWIVVGREHYFDSATERQIALNLPEDAQTLSINEFSDDQIRQYLHRATGAGDVALPHWLPTKPLLVGNFAVRGLAEALPQLADTLDDVDGWSYLLDKVCAREARISPTLDGETLRRILERLATAARTTDDGLGPLTPEAIRRAFVAICGYEPDEQANLLLQRLPGLGVYRSEDATRAFIDAGLAEVCRARDVVSFILDPYTKLEDRMWIELASAASTVCGSISAERAARDLGDSNLIHGKLRAAIQALDRHPELRSTRGDIFLVCLAAGLSIEDPLSIERLFLDECNIVFDANTLDVSSVRFTSCFFGTVELAPTCGVSLLPRFASCTFVRLDGRSSASDLPPGIFDHCDVEQYGGSVATLSAILGLPMTRGQRIMLSLLRKLFIQSLSGRVEGALVRGLDLPDRPYVADLLKLLLQFGYVIPPRGGEQIWLPNRKKLGQVRRILAAPANATDDLLKAAATIQ